MTIDEAIKKAEEISEEVRKIKTIPGYNIFYYLMSPAFWQALGRAKGWEGKQDYYHNILMDASLACWHRFIDHLYVGKTAESFFEELK